MKYKKWILITVILSVLSLFACGKENTAYFEMAEVSQVTEMVENTTATEEAKVADGICYVYVCGAVVSPGVYELKPHDRIYQAVALADGFREDAWIESVNQAEEVFDGQMIKILTVEEQEKESLDEQERLEDEVDDGRIDLNEATASELMTLPGIGESKANSIIMYREQNGKFSDVDDVMKVEGIKDGVFNRIKDHIKVK